MARTVRRLSPSRALGQAATVIAVDGTRVTFRCARNGCEWTEDYSKGPVVKRIGATGVRITFTVGKQFASFCPTCDKR